MQSDLIFEWRLVYWHHVVIAGRWAELIYLDLAIVLNIVVDFLLLLGTNRLTGYPTRWGRTAGAAILGGVYGGVCLLPGFRFLGNLLWRVVCLSGMACMAFGWNRSAIRRCAVFLLLSMALGGITSGMAAKGFWLLTGSAVLIWILCGFGVGEPSGQGKYVPVELTWQGKTIRLLALRDTGNTLRDPVTGEQVLVAGGDVAFELLGLTARQLMNPAEALASGLPGRMRLIPYHTVGQPGGMMLAVRFRNAKIGGKMVDPLVAFAPGEIARGEVYRMLTGGAI